MINCIKPALPSLMASLRETSERTWSTDPIAVNAYNSFPDNAISMGFKKIDYLHVNCFCLSDVPMAILNYPMYHLGLE